MHSSVLQLAFDGALNHMEVVRGIWHTNAPHLGQPMWFASRRRQFLHYNLYNVKEDIMSLQRNIWAPEQSLQPPCPHICMSRLILLRTLRLR